MNRVISNIFKLWDVGQNRAKLAGYVDLCGLDSLKVGKLIAQGMQHWIFEYGNDYVVKVPKFDLFNSIYGILRPKEVESDWKIIKQFFSDYLVDTEVFNSPDNNYYVVLQKRIRDFENLNSLNIAKVIKDFQILHKRNFLLENKLGYSLDLWGKSGILKSIKKSFGRINMFVELSNIVIDKSNPRKLQLKVIDTNLYRVRTKGTGLSRLLTDRIIYLFSDYFLKRGKFLG